MTRYQICGVLANGPYSLSFFILHLFSYKIINPRRNMKNNLFLALFVTSMLLSFSLSAQKAKPKKDTKETTAAAKEVKSGFDTVDISGLKFRSLGPALTSGRISEIAVDPTNPKRFFVAVSSGGVWRTTPMQAQRLNLFLTGRDRIQ